MQGCIEVVDYGRLTAEVGQMHVITLFGNVCLLFCERLKLWIHARWRVRLILYRAFCFYFESNDALRIAILQLRCCINYKI
jgi:hypothetical protein